MKRTALQRLLQPLCRAALHEASPAAACAPSCSYSTAASEQRPYRPVITTDPTAYRSALVQYNRERAKWKRQVSALRRQWLEEHQQERRRQEEVQQRQKQQQQEELERRVAEQRSSAATAQLLHDIRQAELELQIAQERLETAQREEQRQQQRRELEEYRLELLREQSKGWVTAEELAQRIEQALDNPQPLGQVPSTWHAAGDDEEDEVAWSKAS